ncbi:SRPBCC domain-containing protein [Aspergillus undulatus]|uniref:SRPBCC domain-containing protein n=1 Tax=Aspergillus undulatus TaxID=1810928 RepID=UPI003CCD8756
MPDPTTDTHQLPKDTPNIPQTTSILSLQSSITISAPVETVWSALTDTSTYPQWNRFIPRASITSQPNATASSPVLRADTRFTFYANMYPEKHETPQPDASGLNPTCLKIIEYHPPSSGNLSGRICWASDTDKGGFISWFLKAERVHEVSEVEDQDGRIVTAVRNWELQVGVLAYVVKWIFGRRLENNFRIWVEGLKGFVEGQTQQ